MENISLFLDENHVIGFLLLFVRISSLLAFLPLFSNMSIPATSKATFAFYLTLIFDFSIPPPNIPHTQITIFWAILSEVAFGMFVGVFINIVFYTLMYAGEQISLMMGFSMATVFDYQSSISMPVISKFFNFFALMIILALDIHHSMILIIQQSLIDLPLGGFVVTQDIFDYLIKAFKNLFVIGLTLAFPILALSLLSDIIFGMLMKTMPQFNLLVIGYPIKITIGFAVLIAVLSSMVLIFKREIFYALQALQILF
jgi:flagellar biosynthetic protein FliR